MKIIKNLCNFGTVFTWILVLKVLQVNAEYRTDTGAAAAAATLIMKPYPYQIFDDYNTDELLSNERNVVGTTLPIWQTKDKQHLYYKNLAPLGKAATSNDESNGNSMTSNEITFENLNDFGNIKNAIWPGVVQQHLLLNRNSVNDGGDINNNPLLRHSLQHIAAVVVDDATTAAAGAGAGVGALNKQRPNIRYKNALRTIILGKRFTKAGIIKNPKSFNRYNVNDVNDDSDAVARDDVLKENIFPLKDEDDTIMAGDGDAEHDFASSNGNGNENVNYSDNNEVTNNYIMAQNDNHQLHNDKNLGKERGSEKRLEDEGGNRRYKKRVKPSYGHTPFLPSVSGGAMTNLGKFFRDLSKNVHFSEQYQWGADEQKLLEGDPNFGDIHHHLTKPKSATDQQTTEWIKAIRFYRPSQKIRSLVAMNPHGQWAHSSQFIDPNYMWVGLGK